MDLHESGKGWACMRVVRDEFGMRVVRGRLA